MANDPGEWYEERRQEAEHLDFAITHLQAYLRRLDDTRPSHARRAVLTEYLGRLVRDREHARYVGD
jgi:hypothetical protein